MIVFFTPEKERMDSCFRRNDGEATYKWIPAFAGMTGRLRRNDLPEPGARQVEGGIYLKKSSKIQY